MEDEEEDEKEEEADGRKGRKERIPANKGKGNSFVGANRKADEDEDEDDELKEDAATENGVR